MIIRLEYSNSTYVVKVYDRKNGILNLVQAGVRKNKKQAEKLFNQLVREFK